MKKIFVVGIGPGESSVMTAQAHEAISRSELVVGYAAYVALVKGAFPEKDFFSTGMMKERERCRHALSEAAKGRTVSVVCSGDAGVYGMASLVLELLSDFPGVAAEIVPGVTAALSGAAILGSPLTADFCVVSLSNLLMPEEKIERRLRAAAAGDFPIVLYNPQSKSRPDTFRRACAVLLETVPAETPCGFVRNIAREGEEWGICTLGELKSRELDMFTTAFIGNSDTKILFRCGRNWLVNPRGYRTDLSC